MILNRQKTVRLATRSLAQFLQKIQRELKLQKVEVSVAFVSDAEIAGWNQSYRQKKGPTDVLSFPVHPQKSRVQKTYAHKKAAAKSANRKLDAPSGRDKEILGDIAIAPATARRYAKKNQRSLQNELHILMLHGVLHLMGYDHESDNGQMNRIEHRLRRRLGLA
jgi:probable rRNA maturation factor